MIAQTFVLYLNLWGTSAKLLGQNALTGVPAESESELFSSRALRECQVHFATTLSRLGKAENVEVYPVGDFAYAFSSDLPKLVKLAADLMQAMVFPRGHDLIWPVRGAIARGVEKWSVTPLDDQADDSNRPLLPWIGPGLTKAAELEKSAQKGMRLLIETAPVAPDVQFPVRSIAIRGYENFEVNWLKGFSQTEKIPDLARRLMELETNYAQQLSSSLSGLLRWSDGSN